MQEFCKALFNSDLMVINLLLINLDSTLTLLSFKTELPTSSTFHILHIYFWQEKLLNIYAIPVRGYPGLGLLPGLPGLAFGGSKRKKSWTRAVFSNLQRKGLEKR